MRQMTICLQNVDKLSTICVSFVLFLSEICHNKTTKNICNLSNFGQKQDKTNDKLSTNCLSFVLFLSKIGQMTNIFVVLL